MAFINNNSNPKPKKLRIPPNLLPHLQCIAAYTTRNAILTRYAEHKGEEVKPVSKEDIINLISDAVIALEHVFSASYVELIALSNTIFNGIYSFISTSEPFITATGGGTVNLEASHQIAENIAASYSLLK